LDQETLTIGMLAQLYLESPQHLSKKPRTQRADQRCLERVIAFLGSTRDVATLSESDVRRYTLARRQGDPTLKGVTPGRPVRDRAVELDLVMLMTALNWATRERTTTGRRLLRENPLTGVRDETVQSASVRRLAAAGLQVGPDRAAAAWDVALDSAEAGDGAERIPGEGRRRGRRVEDRGSAGHVVPAGRCRNDQERGFASNAPDREPVETHSITHSMG